MCSLGLEKAEKSESKLPMDHHKIKRVLEKNIYFCFIDYTKACEYVHRNKPWKSLKEIGIADHLTCLLRNLYAGQEATVRTGHGTTDWYHLEREYIKTVHCHSAYLTYMQSTL